MLYQFAIILRMIAFRAMGREARSRLSISQYVNCEMVLLALMIGVSGCSYLPDSADMSEIVTPSKFGTFSPMPFYLRDIPQDDSSYSAGWRDGCNTYLGFAGSGLVQMRGFTYDIERSLNDRQYAAGFREGANLCLYYTDTRPN